ncbi:PREDICTED: uncharacterized protein LOC108572717 [Habropoda laboriosa]|uniref:uncharacterized protein LOC108572717 n=1 Tax=Habropoda laboriosa TaxID=597456 RepID=UPI00083D496A|nr:PREDICTED: uncharacterized protein LOC108572717 [Habropoda laboriosa]
MAGAGVGVGMLRARRRDVSVKPNRKLDRKSSRGMIYENEELRLRTININAEVEQGQNDIKKLRRENEQLRREIWSLRDEYDKLEEILKRQKSGGESEEYEDRSDEDDGLRSDYSYEEDEELDQGDQESTKEPSKSEQLENAENQKISTEKMTSSSLHRLHVDFDDLSVVDEEEEPRRDKDKREVPSEDVQQSRENKSPLTILKSTRQLHENIPFYPATYQTPTSLTSPTYYTECPFKFPSTMNLMIPSEASGMVATPDSIGDQILHAPPAGWQTDILMPQKQPTTFGVSDVNGSSGMQNYGRIHQDQMKLQSLESMTTGLSTFPSFLPRRNIGLKLSTNPFNATGFGNVHLNAEKAVVENGWSAHGDSLNLRGAKEQSASDVAEKETEESPALSGTEKPKHFFAPLPSKLKKPAEEPSPTISHFGTGNSSSSGKTGSTVISRNQYMTQKGSADVYVNGAIPCKDSFHIGTTEQQRTYLSTDNLVIAGDKCTPGNQLTKSMSCQDLHRESQTASISHADGRQQMMTKSDNTLDNISDTKPYKSHLTVTLRKPRVKQAVSPDTPEIPKLPSIDYRLFKNPFLRTFDPPSSYMDQNNVTRPLSVQVNDDNLCYYSSQPEVSGFNRGASFGDRYRPTQSDQNRLLIPSTQLTNGKLTSPTSKHQIQVTSFERPSPHTLIGPPSQYDLSTLRRLNSNPYVQTPNLYQNMPFLPRGGLYPQRGMMYYENLALKVPAQTQTSIDGDSHLEEEHVLEETALGTPSGQRRRKMSKKEKGSVKEPKLLPSPANQRKLKKQISLTSSEIAEPSGKLIRKKPRRLSITTTTTSEGQEDKNESRSSSSGQDSPKKDQMRRVSLYFNTKKRPSLTSVKTSRSNSFDIGREKDAMVMNCERERTNSASSREIGSIKARKASTSSEKVPWCACWGNGCI